MSSYLRILTNQSGRISSWKPKHANYAGASPFKMGQWRDRYYEQKSGETNAQKEARRKQVLANFTTAYNEWLQKVERKRLLKMAEINNFKRRMSAYKKAQAASKSVARIAPTRRRNNQAAAALHAGPARPTSLRRQVLTARLPHNVAELVRANARLTNQLRNVVNALKANLRQRANAKFRSPRSAHSR
jgi:hypothetical protein